MSETTKTPRAHAEMAGDNRALRSERKSITGCVKSLQSALKGKEK